jgi:hypothetical protein
MLEFKLFSFCEKRNKPAMNNRRDNYINVIDLSNRKIVDIG